MNDAETQEAENKINHFNHIYLTEVFEQCNYALYAMASLRFALNTQNIKLIFYSVHSFLNHIGNVSKLFWPHPQDIKKMEKDYRRDIELKRILEIPENSPLKDKTFRNHFEHYDSRLDDWVRTSKRHNIARNCVGPKDRMFGGIESDDIFELFDPTNFILYFRGEVYDLLSTENEILILLNKSRELPPELRIPFL
jgi:hypothetical protein